MTAHPLVGIRACVFDAYGTLFDVASAARRAADDLGDAATALAALWRDKQLQYSWLRAVQGRHTDFWQVTGDALDFALDAMGLVDHDRRHRLMQLYRELDAYPEAAGTLQRLRTAGLPTAILSNGTSDMLAAAVAHAGLGGLFDHVLSVEEVGVYKPHPRVYQFALDRLRLRAPEIAFVSSNGWDGWAAAAFGLRAIWCNRQGQPHERLPGAPAAEIRSLAELPPLLGC
ncbi:MAG TPA: haloacid dehalogenase type II [Stellaceae bacterium]|jgi:2-haloacid dehalogenase